MLIVVTRTRTYALGNAVGVVTGLRHHAHPAGVGAVSDGGQGLCRRHRKTTSCCIERFRLTATPPATHVAPPKLNIHPAPHRLLLM